MKRVLVTGSSRGIGRAVARRLAEDGFAVVTHAVRNAAAAGETAADYVITDLSELYALVGLEE